ncbi:MAG: HAD-IA family hydrolase [Clostridia bacterium]|jgi:putative hydrolase of the HAD superfamily
MSKVIFWDFHNTLAGSPRYFTTCLKKVLDENEKGINVMDDDLFPWLDSGFPWQEPEKDYLEFKDPEAWWQKIYSIFEYAFVMNGIPEGKACIYAKEARKHIADPSVYKLYDDTLDTLKKAKEAGYRNVILSNHIPELPYMAKCLGLMEYVDVCISSANVGYEKPNPKIFEIGLEIADHPKTVWMVGDSIDADIRGAEAVGINAVLIRKPRVEQVKFYSPDLTGALEIIFNEDSITI